MKPTVVVGLNEPPNAISHFVCNLLLPQQIGFVFGLEILMRGLTIFSRRNSAIVSTLIHPFIAGITSIQCFCMEASAKFKKPHSFCAYISVMDWQSNTQCGTNIFLLK